MQLFFVLVLVLLHSAVCDYTVSIVHFNDFHARYEPVTSKSTTCTVAGPTCIGGFSRLYRTINRLIHERENNALVLNAGDNFKGTLWYNVHRWNVTQHFLNKLPLDAMTLGNHEFDDGISGLVPFLESIQCAVVVANIDDHHEPRVQNLYNKSVIVEKGSKRIGIIGAITTTTKMVSCTEGLVFRDESVSVNAEARRIAGEVFTNIVLSHCGYQADLDMAKRAGSKISVIVGGHTDTFLYSGLPVPGPDKPSGPYPTVVVNQDGHRVLVVQASAYTKYLGDLTVTYNDLGQVVDWHGSPIFLDGTLPTDGSIDEELEEWKKAVDVEGAKVVGCTVYEMANKPCRSEECRLGNVATDAMVDYYVSTNKTVCPVIALIHAGGMRAGIEKGNITFNELVSTFPFEDTVDSFDIQGLHLKAILESHMDDSHLKSPHLLQVSGLRVTFNVTKPQGRRVESLQVLHRTCFKDIDLDRDYRILVPTFLSTSNFNPLFRLYLKRKSVGEQDSEVYKRYLEKKSPLAQEIEDRIRILA